MEIKYKSKIVAAQCQDMAEYLIASNNIQGSKHMASPFPGQGFNLHQLSTVGWNAMSS